MSMSRCADCQDARIVKITSCHLGVPFYPKEFINSSQTPLRTGKVHNKTAGADAVSPKVDDFWGRVALECNSIY